MGSVRIGSRQGSGFSQDYVLPWPIRINMFFRHKFMSYDYAGGFNSARDGLN